MSMVGRFEWSGGENDLPDSFFSESAKVTDDRYE